MDSVQEDIFLLFFTPSQGKSQKGTYSPRQTCLSSQGDRHRIFQGGCRLAHPGKVWFEGGRARSQWCWLCDGPEHTYRSDPQGRPGTGDCSPRSCMSSHWFLMAREERSDNLEPSKSMPQRSKKQINQSNISTFNLSGNDKVSGPPF